jgi:hypothetical protein
VQEVNKEKEVLKKQVEEDREQDRKRYLSLPPLLSSPPTYPLSLSLSSLSQN